MVKEIKCELRKLFVLTHYVVAELRAICKTLENGTEVAGVTHVIQSCVSIITTRGLGSRTSAGTNRLARKISFFI